MLAAPPFCVMKSLEKDADEEKVFVKYLTIDACNRLATMGNQSVLNDTSLSCNQSAHDGISKTCNRVIPF